jgi:hypothetical protein
MATKSLLSLSPIDTDPDYQYRHPKKLEIAQNTQSDYTAKKCDQQH